MRSNYKRLKGYMSNTSVQLQDRSFVLFSCLVLIALYVAIPLGLIMREPLSATISTVFGAVIFTIFVRYVFVKNKIAQAKVILSIVVVFFFLPSMFFTNGGALSGVPLWLLLGIVYIGLILEGRLRVIMLAANTIVLMLCWIVGYLHPELVTEYTRGQGYFDSLVGLFIISGIIYTIILFCVNLFRKDEYQKNLQRMLEQTETALVNAIDAKDEYTHGHSERVAEYSRKIAEYCGKSPAECDEIYQIALLHDIGKIGISESIINKVGKLTPEEYEVVKQHTTLGAQILESVDEYPNLIIGAKYHHERYDGKGYPDHLKGKEIPEIARIISVADAYDAMTSKRSYRDAIPQHIVREEFVKGIGTQFDPEFARAMILLIDRDMEYKMKESVSGANVTGEQVVHCEEMYHDCTDGIVVTPQKTTIRFTSQAWQGSTSAESIPSIIVFDALDGKVHPGEENNKDLLYFEYAKIRLDGQMTDLNLRKSEICMQENVAEVSLDAMARTWTDYVITAVRNRDHVWIQVLEGACQFEAILALPDTARYVSLSIGGQHCDIDHIQVEVDEKTTAGETLPRIAEEISYTKGCPVGDIPNVEIDGPRLVATEGIEITKHMTISFHTMSYPTARLIWHCPYFCIFSSANGQIGGPNYHEYLLLKMTGENWNSEEPVENEVLINQTGEFEGWKNWLEKNQQGLDCTLMIRREDNMIFTRTENLGISLNSISTIKDGRKKLYIALTGDQCAISNIHITRE